MIQNRITNWCDADPLKKIHKKLSTSYDGGPEVPITITKKKTQLQKAENNKSQHNCK